MSIEIQNEVKKLMLEKVSKMKYCKEDKNLLNEEIEDLDINDMIDMYINEIKDENGFI